MSKSVEAEIKRLRAELEHHNDLYYQQAEPEISDLEFDRLLRRLMQLEQEHPEFDDPDSPSKKVGGKPIEGFVTVPHLVPMLSIENAYSEAELAEFGQRVVRLIGPDPVEWLAEYKVDGVALSLIYEQGKLVRAVTRGDGVKGDDVTHNARTMRGVPLQLKGEVPALLEVRGEAFISNRDFAHLRAEHEKRGAEPLKNPRNATAGGLKLLDPAECRRRRLQFFVHSAGACEGLSLTRHTQFLERATAYGFITVPGVEVRPSFEKACEYTQELMENLHTLDFEVDGIVLKVNHFPVREELGYTSKSPRWIVAYKWERYEAVTQLQKIDIQVGKTGTLTPVAHLEPVEIAGTTVSRSSLHNRDEIERLGVKIGDWVVVEKAGKVIPHVLRVEEQRRTGEELDFEFPAACPECQTPVVRDEAGVYIRCPNPACPAQLRESLRYFASRAAMDIEGLGIKRIEQLTQLGLVNSFADVYRLKYHRAKLVGEKEERAKSIDQLLAGIEASKSRPLWRLLTALNIRHVGQRTAQQLADKFGSLDRIAQQSAATLSDVEEVGPVIAESVATFFQSEIGQHIVAELREVGIDFGSAEAAKTHEEPSGPIAGKSVVVTGTLEHYSREGMQELIRQHGGRAASSVSKQTDYVVAGAEAGSKLTKAQQLGVTVLTEAEFLKLMDVTLPDAGDKPAGGGTLFPL